MLEKFRVHWIAFLLYLNLQNFLCNVSIGRTDLAWPRKQSLLASCCWHNHQPIAILLVKESNKYISKMMCYFFMCHIVLFSMKWMLYHSIFSKSLSCFSLFNPSSSFCGFYVNMILCDYVNVNFAISNLRGIKSLKYSLNCTEGPLLLGEDIILC